MSERVKVRQNSRFETDFWAADPEEPDSEAFQPVQRIHDLTPYGMLLGSVGSCTAVVVNTYAQHHDIDLEEVTLTLAYERVFREDCESCEEIEKYEEQIQEQIRFSGDLSPEEHERLLHIAHQCSIHKMLESGVEIVSREMEAV